MAKRKVIITIAPSSNFHGKEANPALPELPEEIGIAARDCYNVGASVIHFHARGYDRLPTNDPDIIQEVIEHINDKAPKMIIQPSIAPGNRPDRKYSIDDALNAIKVVKDRGAKFEMCSLDCGPSIVSMGDKYFAAMWHRDWVVAAAKKIVSWGIKPELEIFQPAEIETVLEYLVKPGHLVNPSFSFVLGMKANSTCVGWTPENLMHQARMLPPGTLFGALGIGAAQHQATVMSMILGGNARVGFEDNIYYRRGELAKSNAQLVERIVTTAHDLGLEVATPDEAREILGLAPQA